MQEMCSIEINSELNGLPLRDFGSLQEVLFG